VLNPCDCCSLATFCACAMIRLSEFCRPHSVRIIDALLPVLLRGGELHWNVSVNKVRLRVWVCQNDCAYTLWMRHRR
jgi:hypothetical protein